MQNQNLKSDFCADPGNSMFRIENCLKIGFFVHLSILSIFSSNGISIFELSIIDNILLHASRYSSERFIFHESIFQIVIKSIIVVGSPNRLEPSSYFR